MRSRFTPSRPTVAIATMIAACLAAAHGAAQTVAVDASRNESPARIVADPPLAEPLAHGRVVIPYRTENLRIAPVFGPAALAITPRVGHLHISVNNAPWVWAHLSGEPVTLNGLPPGPHKVLLQLQNANHQQLDQAAVQFAVPHSPAAVQPPQHDAARLTVEAPRAEPLSRGVVFIQYRTEPRTGHVQVTVDHAPWSWEDASGEPVIILGLTPGPHRIRIQLESADHRPIAHEVVHVTVPDVIPMRRL